MKCKYEKLNGHCHRKALDNSNRGYCLLHEDWNHKNEEETKEEFYREIEEGETDFEGCILPEVNLSGREIDGIGLSFNKATIKGDINFNDARIDGFVSFYSATIEGSAWFSNTTIKGQLIFTRATIKGIVLLDKKTTVGEIASFDGATMESITIFPSVSIPYLTFKYAKIKDIRAEENACRLAKITQIRAGDREGADYHFYREMVAKRKQRKENAIKKLFK